MIFSAAVACEARLHVLSQDLFTSRTLEGDFQPKDGICGNGLRAGMQGTKDGVSLQMLYLCRPSVCCLIIPLSRHQSQLYVVFQVCQSAGILTVGHTNGEVRVYQFDLSSNQISTAVLNESSASGDLSR